VQGLAVETSAFRNGTSLSVGASATAALTGKTRQGGSGRSVTPPLGPGRWHLLPFPPASGTLRAALGHETLDCAQQPALVTSAANTPFPKTRQYNSRLKTSRVNGLRRAEAAPLTFFSTPRIERAQKKGGVGYGVEFPGFSAQSSVPQSSVPWCVARGERQSACVPKGPRGAVRLSEEPPFLPVRAAVVCAGPYRLVPRKKAKSFVFFGKKSEEQTTLQPP
jgi:hypothetical protein